MPAGSVGWPPLQCPSPPVVAGRLTTHRPDRCRGAGSAREPAALLGHPEVWFVDTDSADTDYIDTDSAEAGVGSG